MMHGGDQTNICERIISRSNTTKKWIFGPTTESALRRGQEMLNTICYLYLL